MQFEDSRISVCMLVVISIEQMLFLQQTKFQVQNLQQYLMSYQNLFKQALQYIKNLPTDGDSKGQSIDNETKLKFYALFKQATVGTNNTKAPSKLKIVDRYKWDEWKKLGKMSKEDAMKTYVEILNKKSPGWNTKPKL